MAKYRVGSDNAGSGTQKCLNKIVEVIRGAGHDVDDLGIDRNLEGKFYSGDKETIDVFVVNGICLGTMVSCYENVIQKGKGKEVFFAIPQETYGGHTIKSAEDIKTKKIGLDSRQPGGWSKMAYQMENKYSTQEICDKLEGINYAYGQTCEEVAQQILAGGGSSSGGTTEESSSSGGSAQIKDKTFENCIRRICAATDSVFIVENNAAVLFPYTDWMALTLQKDRDTIGKDNIDPDIFEIEYNTTGTYNKVTATWGKTNDANKNTKTKSKTDGKFTTKQNTNKDGTVTTSIQYDSLVEEFGELEKKVDLQTTDRNTTTFILNALLIQYIREFNSSYKVRSLNKTKFIGGTFYAVQNLYNDNLDILYLNGYTISTRKDEPLYIDLDFRYGPAGVEDINDYQEYSGSGGSSSNSETSNVNASDILGIAKELASKYGYGGECSTYECMKKKKKGDCYAMSDALFTELSANGYTVQIVQYPSPYSNSGTHRVVQYKDGTEWKPIPYKECGFDTNFNDFHHSKSSEKIIKTNEGGSSSSGSSSGGDTK